MNGVGERRVIHRGKRFDFEVVSQRLEGGAVIQREVVRHPGAVVVLPLLRPESGRGAGEIVLIRNFRIAIGKDLWELPAGTLEPGEAPEACAARELEEEAGYRAGSIRPLGAFYTTPGMTDELMRLFLATDLTHVGQRLEAEEQIEAHPTPVEHAFEMIESGELMDAKSMLAILLADSRGLLRGGAGGAGKPRP